MRAEGKSIIAAEEDPDQWRPVLHARIRLTGRRQLPLSAISVSADDRGDHKVMSLTIVSGQAFHGMPPTSRVKLRLFKNNVCETLHFGLLGDLLTKEEAVPRCYDKVFSAPRVRLLVVGADDDNRGRILGSTSRRTILTGGDGPGRAGGESLLHFQTKNLGDRVWSLGELDAIEDEFPVVYVNDRIPSPYQWVQGDPVFVGCVLPAIIRELFEVILSEGEEEPRARWQKDWLEWAKGVNGVGDKPPLGNAGEQDKREWIDNLTDEFCRRHGLLDRLVAAVGGEERK